MEQQTEQVHQDPIHKDMTMGEILQKYPATAEVMTRYGLHCVGCHVNTFETLEQGMRGHGGSYEQVESMLIEMNDFVKNQKFSNNKEIAITEKAANKIKELIQKHPDKTGVKVQVLSGGCSGLSYDFSLVVNPDHDDKTLEQFGVNIYIDQESLNHISGSKIDFVDALQGAGFKVSNPKATSTCGCGQSFS